MVLEEQQLFPDESVIPIGESQYSIVDNRENGSSEILILNELGEACELLCTPTDLHYCFKFEREITERFKSMRISDVQVSLLIRNIDSKFAEEVTIESKIMNLYSPEHETHYGVVVHPLEYSGLLVSQICGSWVVVRPYMIRQNESQIIKEKLINFSQRLAPQHVREIPRSFSGRRDRNVNLDLDEETLLTGMCFSFQEVQGSFDKIGTIDFGNDHRIIHDYIFTPDFFRGLEFVYAFTPFPSIDSPIFSNWQNTVNANVGYCTLHQLELIVDGSSVYLNNPSDGCMRRLVENCSRVTFALWLPKKNSQLQEIAQRREKFRQQMREQNCSDFW